MGSLKSVQSLPALRAARRPWHSDPWHPAWTHGTRAQTRAQPSDPYISVTPYYLLLEAGHHIIGPTEFDTIQGHMRLRPREWNWPPRSMHLRACIMCVQTPGVEPASPGHALVLRSLTSFQVRAVETPGVETAPGVELASPGHVFARMRCDLRRDPGGGIGLPGARACIVISVETPAVESASRGR